jgi:hypothetical protein
VLEIKDDGTSKIIARGQNFYGLVAGGADEVFVSDCGASTIVKVVPSTGNTTNVMTSTDGINCAIALARTTGGDLLYLNMALTSPFNPIIGKRAAAGTVTASFVTGLPEGTMGMALAGDTIITGGQGVGIYKASATTGGAATVLVPLSLVYAGAFPAASSTGIAYLEDFILGDIYAVDTTTGALDRLGSLTLTGGALPVILPSLGVMDDGTVYGWDVQQVTVVVVAP